MRQILRKHGLTHRLTSSDPGEIGLAPASVMGTVIGSATLSNGLVLYKGTLYLPDRDGPALEAGEEIIISYSHFEPVEHFSWMGARAHVLTGLDASEYDYRHPWESDPWAGGSGTYALADPYPSFGGWAGFVTFAAVTNDDGEVVTWTLPDDGPTAEQYAFDDTGVGHIGYLLHEFGTPHVSGNVTAAFSGASTERAGSINWASGSPVTVGDMVGESQVAATSSEIGITLTEDVPAGSQLLIVTAAKGPAGFSPTDAGSRPQIILRLPSGSLVPKFVRGQQQHPFPETPSTGTSIPSGLPPSGAAGGALDGTYPNPGIASSVAGSGLSESSNVLAVNVDGSTIEINADTLRVKDGGITTAKLAFDPATQAELDAAIAAVVPTTRTLTAGAALTGGGDLSSDRTFDVAVDGSTIEVSSDALRVKADGITANEIAAGAVGASELASTAVTPGTYGDSTHVAAFTVDADGRITSASSVATAAGTNQHILLADGRATPFTFDDMLQMDDGSDFMWSDPA